MINKVICNENITCKKELFPNQYMSSSSTRSLVHTTWYTYTMVPSSFSRLDQPYQTWTRVEVVNRGGTTFVCAAALQNSFSLVVLCSCELTHYTTTVLAPLHIGK